MIAMNDTFSTLQPLGWSEEWAGSISGIGVSGWRPGRIAVEHKNRYRLWDGEREFEGIVSGRFHHEACKPSDFPVVGDWVLFEPSEYAGPVSIQKILPRRSCLTRKAAGETSSNQPLAANFDKVLITTSCNADFSLNRILRFLTLAQSSNILPIVLLTKLDLINDPTVMIDEVRCQVGAVPVLPVSAKTGEGLDVLQTYLQPGQTIAVVGSSGVGKSTLVNRLMDSSLLAVNPVREWDDKGRHTTTHRQMVLLPDGAILIDTPGIREVGLIDSEGGIEATFPEILERMKECRFTDCQHEAEPGCAVQLALANGEIQLDRYKQFTKMRNESDYQHRRESVHLQQQRKRQDKQVHQMQKQIYKNRDKR